MAWMRMMGVRLGGLPPDDGAEPGRRPPGPGDGLLRVAGRDAPGVAPAVGPAVGKGVDAHQPIGAAVRNIEQTEMNLRRIERDLHNHKPGRADRRRAQAEITGWQQRRSAATRDLEPPPVPSSAPERHRRAVGRSPFKAVGAAPGSPGLVRAPSRSCPTPRPPRCRDRHHRRPARPDPCCLDPWSGREHDYPWLGPSAMARLRMWSATVHIRHCSTEAASGTAPLG
jgi:hypothetical protein